MTAMAAMAAMATSPGTETGDLGEVRACARRLMAGASAEQTQAMWFAIEDYMLPLLDVPGAQPDVMSLVATLFALQHPDLDRPEESTRCILNAIRISVEVVGQRLHALDLPTGMARHRRRRLTGT